MSRYDITRCGFNKTVKSIDPFKMGRRLTVPEKHQLKIARNTLRMPDAMVGVMGGMDKDTARRVIFELTGVEHNTEEQ